MAFLTEQSELPARSSDPTLHHPAVVAYNDIFKLQLSPGFRRDVIATVEIDCADGLKAWREILENWGYWKDGKWVRKNPTYNRATGRHSVVDMIQYYELRMR